MSHPACLVIHPELAGCAPGGSRRGTPAGNAPTGTCGRGWVRDVKMNGINALHPIGLFCQGINDKLLMLLFPSSHLSTRVHHRLDILLNVLHLSPLVMQG